MWICLSLNYNFIRFYDILLDRKLFCLLNLVNFLEGLKRFTLKVKKQEKQYNKSKSETIQRFRETLKEPERVHK